MKRRHPVQILKQPLLELHFFRRRFNDDVDAGHHVFHVRGPRNPARRFRPRRVSRLLYARRRTRFITAQQCNFQTTPSEGGRNPRTHHARPNHRGFAH